MIRDVLVLIVSQSKGRAMYTIGQAAEITGISKDRLRYYEEKGILKPEINTENRYRQYSEENMIEILSIELFRSMDLGMKDIKNIRADSDAETVNEIMSRKRDIVLKEIAKQQQILAQIDIVYNGCQRLKDHLNKVAIRPMPILEVLGEISDTTAFAEYANLHHKKESDNPILKSMVRQITFSEGEINTNRMLIVRDLEKEACQDQIKILKFDQCLYTIVEESISEADIMPVVFEKCTRWMIENNYQSLEIAFVRVLFITYPNGNLTSYLEIFSPFIKA